jgi:CRP-like cAMP-binding protein
MGVYKSIDQEDNMKEGELGKTYKDKEVICCEGDKGNSMFVIQSGKVDVIKNLPEGEIKFTTLSKGDIFGEMSLFDRMPRSATVRAVGEAVVLSVDKKGFFAKASRDPTLAFHILEGMSKRIRALDNELSRYRKDHNFIF